MILNYTETIDIEPGDYFYYGLADRFDSGELQAPEWYILSPKSPEKYPIAVRSNEFLTFRRKYFKNIIRIRETVSEAYYYLVISEIID